VSRDRLITIDGGRRTEATISSLPAVLEEHFGIAPGVRSG
jgi:hypothetical protein